MNNDINKKRVFLDMDNVLADFASGMDKVGPELLSKYKPDEVPGIFALMDPMPGAIDAVERLISETGLDLFEITADPADIREIMLRAQDEAKSMGCPRAFTDEHVTEIIAKL